MSGHDPATLSDRARFLLKLNLDNIARVENRYANQLMGDNSTSNGRRGTPTSSQSRRQVTRRNRTPTPTRFNRNDRAVRTNRNERIERNVHTERHERNGRHERNERSTNVRAVQRPPGNPRRAGSPPSNRDRNRRPSPPPARAYGARVSSRYIPGRRPRVAMLPNNKKPESKEPNKLQVAIHDHSDVEGKMKTDKWLELESKILEAMVEEGTDDEIAFDGAGWKQGRKIITCSNEKSLNFLKRTIANLCEEMGENLEIVTREKPSLRPLISIWIPPPVPETKESVLNLINRQNKELQTDDWRILDVKRSEKKGGKDFIITLSRSSLSKLQNNGSHIKFGLGALKARIYSLLECEKIEQSLRDRAKNGHRSPV